MNLNYSVAGVYSDSVGGKNSSFGHTLLNIFFACGNDKTIVVNIITCLEHSRKDLLLA